MLSSSAAWRATLAQIYRAIRPVFDPRGTWDALRSYPKYLADLSRFRKMLPPDPEREFHFFPVLGEDTSKTAFSAHYLCMGDWALRKVIANPAPAHVDVGSQIYWVVSVAASKPITFIDIRPADLDIVNVHGKSGSLMALPYRDQELASLSCLHVIEHIGLGRYGDPLDPDGTHKAVRELARVLAPGGTLLVALPVGRTQLFFNAHRVHRPSLIIAWFEAEGLRLKSYAAVTDADKYLPQANPADFETSDYTCGMFEFVR